ncbi:MAG: hypothetical protein WAT53_06315 [Nitrosomonas sp.]
MKVGQYVIRRQDRHAAIAFVEQKLNQEPQWIGVDENQQLIAKQEYFGSLIDPDGMNAWCEKWLNDVQWEQLRQAISVGCDVQENRQLQPLKTISLSHQAWEILADLAQQSDTTLSNVIITHLGNVNFTACIQTETDYNRNSLNQDNPAMSS